MNNKQANLFLKALIILIIIFICSATYIYKVNQTMNIIGKFNDTILNLILINNRLKFTLENNILRLNYDNVNKDLINFDSNLSKLNKLNSLIQIFQTEKSSKFLKNLNDDFTRKRKLVDRSNYASSSMATYIISSEFEINTEQKFTPLNGIFYAIKSTAIINPATLNQTEEQIKKYKDLYKNDSKAILILDKASFALDFAKNLNTIAEESSNMELGKNLKNFREYTLASHMTMLRNVVIAQFLCLISFTFICILFFYQSKAIKRHLKKIKLLEDTIDTAYSSVIFCDTNNKFLYVNKTFETKTGYKMRDLIGRTPSILKSNMHPESFYAEIRNAIKNHISWESEELISRTRNGNLIYEKVRFAPFIFDGKLEGYMAIKLDRTKEFSILAELTQKNDQIKIQSSIDKLTGFGNYFALTEMIEAKKDGILISISIKNYKMLRFFYQNKVIEAMLKAVANTLKLCVDTYSINAELFRFQDDAFYIWYQGDDIVRDIGFIKEYFNFSRMNIEIDGKFENLPGIKITLGVSLSNDTPQTNRLMQSILANQQASDSGNEIYYYLENDAIEMRYYKNQLITELIEYALENDKVIVECQGIFNVHENETEAKYYEVLVRIVDQNGKIRYPGEFLEIAMKTQLYLQITKKVIALAFDLVKKYSDYTFSINLSSSDLTDPGVREILDEKLESCPDPSRVCFEMLESEELSDYGMANEFIKRAKKYGCKISIDDFGSGYSNYYRILELDIDNIKIDGSIIKKLPTDENARVLVETIVSFARRQGYKIVAEFVSNEEILEYIKKFGISYAQGFLLGKPHQM